MILIERRVEIKDTTFRVLGRAWALNKLWALSGERVDQLVRGTDAGQVG
jgi:hypothetical protein